MTADLLYQTLVVHRQLCHSTDRHRDHCTPRHCTQARRQADCTARHCTQARRGQSTHRRRPSPPSCHALCAQTASAHSRPTSAAGAHSRPSVAAGASSAHSCWSAAVVARNCFHDRNSSHRCGCDCGDCCLPWACGCCDRCCCGWPAGPGAGVGRFAVAAATRHPGCSRTGSGSWQNLQPDTERLRTVQVLLEGGKGGSKTRLFTSILSLTESTVCTLSH